MGFMTYDEFRSRLTNMTATGDFSFGFNWLDYVNSRVDEEIINSHQNDLFRIYSNIPTRGNLIDIGCGSGLSSLCFRRLGFNSVTSIDYDPHSIKASTLMMDKFGGGLTSKWSVAQGSILDEMLVAKNLAKYDVVYSWGVLHHTGNMWQAIRNASAMVKSGGYFHVTLYRSSDKYTECCRQKFTFSLLDKEGKMNMLYRYLESMHKQTGVDVFSPKDNRGMNHFHDALDWLGGIPYEVCDPDVMNSYMWSLGFIRTHFQDMKHGPYLDIYRRR